MTAQVQLSDDETAQVMREAVAIAADRILADALIGRKGAARLLNVSLATLNRLPVKRVKIGGTTSYRMADLKRYIDSCLE
jgi:hypothetical protein